MKVGLMSGLMQLVSSLGVNISNKVFGLNWSWTVGGGRRGGSSGVGGVGGKSSPGLSDVSIDLAISSVSVLWLVFSLSVVVDPSEDVPNISRMSSFLGALCEHDILGEILSCLSVGTGAVVIGLEHSNGMDSMGKVIGLSSLVRVVLISLGFFGVNLMLGPFLSPDGLDKGFTVPVANEHVTTSGVGGAGFFQTVCK